MWGLSFLSFVGGIRGALSVAATIAICWMLHSLSMEWAKKTHAREIEKTAESLRAECADNQRKLDEVTHDYTARLKSINTRHADSIGRLLRHEANKCNSSASVDDGTARADRVYRAAGIIDLGRTAEENTAKLIACQAYVKEISE